MTKTAIVEFPSTSGPVFVEIEEAIAGPQPVARPGEAAAKATETFQDAVKGIRPIAEAVLDQVRGLGPERVTVEFGIKFTVSGNVVLAAAGSEGNCRITLSWKPGTAG